MVKYSAKAGASVLRFAMVALVLTLSACGSGSSEVSGSSDVSALTSQVESDAQVASFDAAPFYVEFRTRPYFTITHTFLTYGALDPGGHPLERKTAGFFPNGGALGPFIGIIGIGGVVGEEDYYADLPSSATYRRNLTAQQFQHLVMYIDKERAHPQVYNLMFNNCNDFIAGAAIAIGLKAPMLRTLPPPVFIQLLAEMNT
jgi:hypothetical protein